MPTRTGTLLATIVAVIVAACGADGESGPDPDAGPPVPERTFETFEGERTSLQEFEGEPLVVNFWASWCPPCVAEMPDFERVHLARQDEVRFVGLNTQDGLTEAEALVEQTGVTYDLGLDPDGDLFRDFEVIAMPSTYFVNRAGAIVHRHAGILSEAELHELIDEHLAPEAGGT